ncbi:cell division protein ZapE [Parvularcula marina]|uniref:cell division protein ZapE n=1 Tax=Parvularcula marina TaxID=2292771 RepID=UPI0035112F3D
MPSPLSAYDAMVRDGTLQPDPAQRAGAEALDRLAKSLKRYDPAAKGLFRKTPKPPKGLYLWGGVGAGKSLLMDLFFEKAPVRAKLRVHFHAFMQRTHRFIRDWRAMDEKTRRSHPSRMKGASLDDPIPHAANHVFAEAHLLCFDEFQVSDITDAMLLGRLFGTLFELGAVVVATSNRHPDDLYKDGLNRQLFLPAIALLKERLEVMEISAARDYRLGHLEGDRVYFSPLGKDATAMMDELFARMTARGEIAPMEIDVGRRSLHVPCASRGVARGPFKHWCSEKFGPGDYLTLASEFPVVFIDNIPLLGPENRNEAKRFVTFIDALYEARAMLICSAAAEPDGLYPSGDGAFEFQRTASRLHEMRSRDYLSQEHEGVSEQAAE